MIFLMVSGDLSAVSSMAEVASLVILTFLKVNLFLKWSNHTLWAFTFPSLCHILTLLYFEYRVYRWWLTYIMHLHRSCIFNMRLKKKTLFYKMCKVFTFVVSHSNDFPNSLFFFYNGFLYWIYLEMAGICNIILVMSQLFPASWEHFQHH